MRGIIWGTTVGLVAAASGGGPVAAQQVCLLYTSDAANGMAQLN